MSRCTFAAVALLLAVPQHAWAHAEHHPEAGATEKLVWDAMTAVALLLAAVVYAAGFALARNRLVVVSMVRALAFYAGLASIASALLSPLDALSDVRFSAHMGQHELLVLFGAPLVVAGAPDRVMRAVLPSRGRQALAAVLHRREVAAAVRLLGNRWFAVALHGVVVWVWHIPVLFEAALESETIHAVQHLSFFSTAVVFWWAMVRGRYGRLGYGVAVLFVFITALHKGVLAMLFAVSDRTFYPTHVARTAAEGRDPVADQQLAGMLMWVPAGVVMAALAVGLFVAWLGALDRRHTTRS